MWETRNVYAPVHTPAGLELELELLHGMAWHGMAWHGIWAQRRAVLLDVLQVVVVACRGGGKLKGGHHAGHKRVGMRESAYERHKRQSGPAHHGAASLLRAD